MQVTDLTKDLRPEDSDHQFSELSGDGTRSPAQTQVRAAPPPKKGHRWPALAERCSSSLIIREGTGLGGTQCRPRRGWTEGRIRTPVGDGPSPVHASTPTPRKAAVRNVRFSVETRLTQAFLQRNHALVLTPQPARLSVALGPGSRAPRIPQPLTPLAPPAHPMLSWCTTPVLRLSPPALHLLSCSQSTGLVPPAVTLRLPASPDPGHTPPEALRTPRLLTPPPALSSPFRETSSPASASVSVPVLLGRSGPQSSRSPPPRSPSPGLEILRVCLDQPGVPFPRCPPPRSAECPVDVGARGGCWVTNRPERGGQAETWGRGGGGQVQASPLPTTPQRGLTSAQPLYRHACLIPALLSQG